MVEYPFSNGTEGFAWMDVWCDECTLDHDMHDPNGSGGCPIFLKSILHEPVEEWDEYTNEEGQYFMPPAIVCRSFQQCEESHPCDTVILDGMTHRQFAEGVRLATPTIRREPYVKS